MDDHPVVREGLRAVLEREPDIEVVAIAETCGWASTVFEEHRPDVTVMADIGSRTSSIANLNYGQDGHVERRSRSVDGLQS